jgi:N-acetylneuraminic acid mutarotase
VDQTKRVAALLLVVLLGACGGAGDEDESSPPRDPNAAEHVGRGSLTIEQPTAASSHTTEEDSVFLSGSAFISPTHFRCCTGSAADTGVEVSSSTGSSVSQSATYCQPFGFGPLTVCNHTWSTRITNLPVGDTRITLEARDPSGNIGRDSITIKRLPDTRRPTVSSTAPAPNASNIALNTSIRATFSEAMDPSSITAATFRVADSNGNTVVGTVSSASRDATFLPASALAAVTAYTATLTTGVRDAAGNPLAAAHAWTFSTAAIPDTTPPSVVSTSPADGSSCAGTDTVITVSFSEEIRSSSIRGSSFQVVDVARNMGVSGTLAASTGTSATFRPSLGLALSSQYRVTLASGVRDLAGNAMPANHAWTFFTVPSGVGTWHPTGLTNAPQPGRKLHSAIWTGTEMIVWGGLGLRSGFFEPLASGARYRPTTDSWVPMSETAPAPAARYAHVAVWTGSEMIVWGGNEQRFDGARYDPITDLWRPMEGTALVGGEGLRAVWTGSEMLVFRSAGAAYNPGTNTWRPMAPPPAALGTAGQTVIWTGTRMIVWGGLRDTDVGAGAAYDPVTDTWQPIDENGAPSARQAHTAVWTGGEMIIWGGFKSTGEFFNTGAIYNPQTDSWRAMSTCGASVKSSHSALWTGTEMMVWGGGSNTGQRYDVATDSWRQMSVVDAPSATSEYSAIWTGSEMLLWGGGNVGSREGARYQP